LLRPKRNGARKQDCQRRFFIAKMKSKYRIVPKLDLWGAEAWIIQRRVLGFFWIEISDSHYLSKARETIRHLLQKPEYFK